MKQLHDGEWETPISKGYKLQCCRCGLKHRVNFRYRRRRIQFQAFNLSRKVER